MDSLDTFKKWFQIITTKYPLNRFDMDSCINELLPGYSYERSSHGPRATKFIYKDDKCVFSNNYNSGVGMQALQMAADTDHKKAILAAYDTKRKINDLLRDLKRKLKFDIDVIVMDGEVNIQIPGDRKADKIVLW